MISSTLGAPLGGTTRAGQYGFDWLASRLISPPNFGGGGGRYFPSIVVVALGEPGAPVVCCAIAGTRVSTVKVAAENTSAVVFMDRSPLKHPFMLQEGTLRPNHVGRRIP